MPILTNIGNEITLINFAVPQNCVLLLRDPVSPSDTCLCAGKFNRAKLETTAKSGRLVSPSLVSVRSRGITAAPRPLFPLANHPTYLHPHRGISPLLSADSIAAFIPSFPLHLEAPASIKPRILPRICIRR